MVVLRLAPMAGAVGDSLFHYSLSTQSRRWEGLGNYIYLLSSPEFRQVLAVTALFLVIIVPVQVGLALLVATLLAERTPGIGAVRTMVFLPVAAPAAVAALTWGVAYQPKGVINAVLGWLGLPDQPFLSSSDQALLAIIVIMSWTGIGYWTMFLVAGLQDIPLELYEAAAIDGAGWWACFRRITLPNLRKTLAFVVVADTVSSVLSFVPVQALTQGGPSGSTRLIMYDLYNRSFALGDTSLGQAEVVLLLICLIGVVAVQFRLLSRGEA
jgi:multiple sugar transport system permease protein